jgi:F-type H+-transporting ATPase subunit b
MGPFTVDSGLTFWTAVTFGCLFLLLARFAFRPMRTLLRKREDIIRKSLEKAEKAVEEAREILARNEERIGEARGEVRRLIDEGHRTVARMKREGSERARQEADAIVRQARDEIDRELTRSLDELKSTVAGLSVRIARQVIKGRLDEKQHEKLADEFVERLKKTRATRRP